MCLTIIVYAGLQVEVVPKMQGGSEDDVYLVYHEYDARTHTSDIVVVDGKVCPASRAEACRSLCVQQFVSRLHSMSNRRIVGKIDSRRHMIR